MAAGPGTVNFVFIVSCRFLLLLLLNWSLLLLIEKLLVVPLVTRFK